MSTPDRDDATHRQYGAIAGPPLHQWAIASAIRSAIRLASYLAWSSHLDIRSARPV